MGFIDPCISSNHRETRLSTLVSIYARSWYVRNGDAVYYEKETCNWSTHLLHLYAYKVTRQRTYGSASLVSIYIHVRRKLCPR